VGGFEENDGWLRGDGVAGGVDVIEIEKIAEERERQRSVRRRSAESGGMRALSGS
jgi:hypothetical protein